MCQLIQSVICSVNIGGWLTIEPVSDFCTCDASLLTCRPASSCEYLLPPSNTDLTDEKHSTPALFEPYADTNNPAVDEYTLHTILAADTANGGLDQIKDHYNTFVVRRSPKIPLFNITDKPNRRNRTSLRLPVLA